MIQEAASLWAGIKKFEEILRRDPQALSFAPLAELYRKAGLLEDALAVANRGAAIYPDFAAGQMVLARIFLDKSMKNEATAALQSVVRITPENTEAQRLLANIYKVSGNLAAAELCYSIVKALEPDSVDNIPVAAALPEQHTQVSPSTLSMDENPAQDFDLPGSIEQFDEEEIMDADVLDLVDELPEEETSAAFSYSPFSAAPERPSLQLSATASEPSPLPAEEVKATSPVATATIAELYITQGFKDKGADLYRELLLADPGNTAYRNRLDDLTSALLNRADDAETATNFIDAGPGRVPPSQGVVETLEGWLSNIRRVKECRSEHP